MTIKRKTLDNCTFGAVVNIGSKNAANDQALRPFGGIAYGGGVIENHWYWDRVIFDLATLTVPNPLAALVDHDSSMRAGVIKSSTVEGNKLEITGTLLRSQFGQEVASDSDDGFPWQMSVRIDPDRIDFIDDKTSTVVNGVSVSGPLNIFRDSTLLEISFCANGWDRTTSAVAMSRAVTAENVSPTPQGTTMTEAEMQAKIDAANAETKKFRDAAEATATAAAAAARATRFSAAKALLTELNGAAPTDAEVDPFADMSETAFAAVATQMRKAKPAPTVVLPRSLFAHTATTGDPAADAAGKTPSQLRTESLQRDAATRLANHNRSKGLPADTPATF